jgi:hypothetical protein
VFSQKDLYVLVTGYWHNQTMELPSNRKIEKIA